MYFLIGQELEFLLFSQLLDGTLREVEWNWVEYLLQYSTLSGASTQANLPKSINSLENLLDAKVSYRVIQFEM